MIDRYVIPAGVLDVVRRHADSARPGGWEVGGELLAEQDRLVAYRPRQNLSDEAGFYEPAELPTRPWMLLHTHPQRSAALSAGDVEWMVRNGRDRLAVFAPDRAADRLIVWHLDEGQENPRPVPVVVERRSSRRLPSRRPGRRG